MTPTAGWDVLSSPIPCAGPPAPLQQPRGFRATGLPVPAGVGTPPLSRCCLPSKGQDSYCSGWGWTWGEMLKVRLKGNREVVPWSQLSSGVQMGRRPGAVLAVLQPPCPSATDSPVFSEGS